MCCDLSTCLHYQKRACEHRHYPPEDQRFNAPLRNNAFEVKVTLLDIINSLINAADFHFF